MAAQLVAMLPALGVLRTERHRQIQRIQHRNGHPCPSEECRILDSAQADGRADVNSQRVKPRAVSQQAAWNPGCERGMRGKSDSARGFAQTRFSRKKKTTQRHRTAGTVGNRRVPGQIHWWHAGSC